jgi:hypothetical protein
MRELPVSCVKAVWELTQFWMAYPLEQSLSPGSYGRKVKGVFWPDGQISDFAGYSAADCATTESPARSQSAIWMSQGARVERFGAGVDSPALPVDGHVQLTFSQANQVALLCRNGREWSFTKRGLVKQYLLSLFRQGAWNVKDILITDVMKTDAAWLFYSSQSGQSVNLSLSVAAGAGPAAALLSAAIGRPEFGIGYSWEGASGYSTSVPGPGTPLFQAIQIKRLPHLSADIVLKGDGDVFDSPTFGDEDDEE